MSDHLASLPRTPKIIGIAADHGGYELKRYLVKTFLAARFSGAERHRRRLSKVAALEP